MPRQKIAQPIYSMRGGTRFAITLRKTGALVALMLIAAPATAEMRSNYWKNVDGIYSESSNWTDDNFYPSTIEDWAFFNTGATNEVAFTGDETIYSAHVEGSASDILWALGGHTYTLISEEGTSHVSVNPALKIERGKLTVTGGHLVAYSLKVDIVGSLTFSGTNTTMECPPSGSVVNHLRRGTLRIENGAQATLNRVLNMGHESSRIGAIEIDGENSELTNLTTVYAGYYGHGKISVKDGGHWNAKTIDLNRNQTSIHNGSGTIEIDNGTISATQLQNAIGSDAATNAHFRVTLHAGGTNALIALSGNLAIKPGFKFYLELADDFTSHIGEVFTIIEVGGERTGLFENPLAGYAQLEEGEILVLGDTGSPLFQGFKFKASYNGGAGHDFTLTTMEVPVSGMLFRVW